MTIPGLPPFGQPPHIAHPVLHAALAVEIAPQRVFWYQVRIDPHDPCTINLEQDVEPIHLADYLDPLRYVAPSPPYLRASLSGWLVSNDTGWRPGPARADSALGIQRQLPAGGDR